MGKTPLDPDNKKFTDLAHEAAQSKLYPLLTGVSREQLEFVTSDVGKNIKSTMLDGEMAIDRTVKIHLPDFQFPFSLTVQERFRRPHFASFRDITITEWNPNSNLPSELYKLNAQIFLYGYFNPQTQDFIEAIAVDTSSLLFRVFSEGIAYGRGVNPRTNQPFLCFKFDDLINEGCVWMKYSNGNGSILERQIRLPFFG
jgi:hypothetical protein